MPMMNHLLERTNNNQDSVSHNAKEILQIYILGLDSEAGNVKLADPQIITKSFYAKFGFLNDVDKFDHGKLALVLILLIRLGEHPYGEYPQFLSKY